MKFQAILFNTPSGNVYINNIQNIILYMHTFMVQMSVRIASLASISTPASANMSPFMHVIRKP